MIIGLENKSFVFFSSGRLIGQVLKYNYYSLEKVKLIFMGLGGKKLGQNCVNYGRYIVRFKIVNLNLGCL